jgi:beta-lactamase regulating signal transducer with metallopeptidase domain
MSFFTAAIFSFVPGLDGMARAAAGVAVNSLWQGAAIALGLAVCLRLGPRTSAAHRFALWLAAFVVLAGLPLLPWLAGFLSHATVAAEPMSQASAATGGPWLWIDSRWSAAIAAVWAAAALVRLAVLAVNAARARRIWRGAQPLVGLEALAGERLLGRAHVQICITKRLERPCVIGFFRPRILIPAWLQDKLTEGEFRQIVLHEVEHLRRLDDWTNLAQKLCLAALPLNPALMWMERRLCREREMACDEGVVRQTRAPRAYAACLASLAERGMEAKSGVRMLRQAEALSLGAWRRRPELAERVYSLLRGKQTATPAVRLAMAGVLVCGLLTTALALARCPQLVAFVPARNDAARPNVAAVSSPDIQPIAAIRRTAVHRQGAPESVRQTASAVASSDERADSDHRSASAANEAAMAVPVAAHLHPQQGRGATEEPTQWVVLAVWEQTVTFAQRSPVVADYDTGSGEEAGQGGDGVSTTQLILKLLPARPVAAQPVPAPMHEGWVVFEL